MTEYRTIHGARVRSFIIPAEIKSSGDLYDIDFPTDILWDDETEILWDDGTTIQWSNTANASPKEIPTRKRSFIINAKVNP